MMSFVNWVAFGIDSTLERAGAAVAEGLGACCKKASAANVTCGHVVATLAYDKSVFKAKYE